MRTFYKGKWRSIHDGGGLCSPGRWPVAGRSWERSEKWLRLREIVRKGFLRWVLEMNRAGCNSKDAVADVFWRMAGGKLTSSPFEGAAADTAGEVDAFLMSCGMDVLRCASDQHSEVHFRRLAGALQLLQDPDFAYLTAMAENGVSLGVDESMPRVPEVFEEKCKWNREFTEDAMAPEQVAENYASSKECMSTIREQVREDVAKGLVKRMSLSEARARFPGRLAIAALGAVPKGAGSDEVHIVFDASYSIDINRRIKVLDQLRSPLIDDVSAVLRQLREEFESVEASPSWLSLVYDIAMAHRLVPVRPEDWGLQAFSLDEPEEVFVHKRGTFGVCSAAYWWSRVASGAVRLLHALADRDLAVYHMLYSDDGWLNATGEYFWRKILFWIFALQVFELPLSWKKVRGGREVQWIGYQLNVKDFSRGISEKKVRWFSEWLGKHSHAGGVLGHDLKAALGRLTFVGGALQHVRPFLGPLFAWSAVLSPGHFVQFPLAVFLILCFIREEISRVSMKVVERIPQEEGDFFRVDARAGKDCVVVGGWESMGGCCTQEARWFSVRLNRRNAPWAFVKWEPFRVIASLELVAVLVAVMTFGQGGRWCHRRGQLWLPAITDNLGNSYVLEKFMASTFPMSVVLMELSAQLGRMDMHLQLGWVPRDQNREADALTNECFADFNPAHRVEVQFDKLPFIVLDSLMSAAQELDADVKLAKTSKEAKVPLPNAKRQKLRWTEPW